MSWRETESRDELTGTYKYEAFLKAFEEAIPKAEEGASISLVVVDVDNIRRINEEHGSRVGDEVLRLLAKNLEEAASGRGAVFRHRLDEFIVLLPNTEREEAFLAFERTRARLEKEQSFETGGEKATLSVPFSAGVSSYPDDGSRSDDVLRKASEALHRAKTGGRNRICLSKQEKMVTKTSHDTRRQLEALAELAKREGVGEAVLLREG